MELETIVLEKIEGIATIRLNRPHVLNAMNERMWVELLSALESIAADPEIAVLIITGEGRAFSSGADLKESRHRTVDAYRNYLYRLQEVSRILLRFPKATIAAINGYALGSGYELALACDIRLAAQDAQIGSPEARVASSVTGGAFRLLQDLVGPGKARELLFSGDFIDGREAERIGLVNRSVPGRRLWNETMSLAEKIRQNAVFSIQLMKKGLLMAAGEASLESLMDFEVEACIACVSTAEREKSLDRFDHRKQEKKSPE